MTHATVVNPGREKGVCARMTQYISETYGHDVLALECLYHSIELYLNDIITAYDGNTKAPDKLVKDSTVNFGYKRFRYKGFSLIRDYAKGPK